MDYVVGDVGFEGGEEGYGYGRGGVGRGDREGRMWVLKASI